MKDTNQTTYLIAAEEADIETIHHMLTVTLREQLLGIFNSTAKSPILTFQDSLDDFLLFLYYGPAYMQEAGLRPFSLLLRVEHSSSLYQWVKSAYRIRLRQTAVSGRRTLTEPDDSISLEVTSEDERHELCNAMAICISESGNIGRFIILRWLLTVLEPDRAIRQEPMAKAAGISHANYRVSTKRQKDRLKQTLKKVRTSVSHKQDRPASELYEDLYTNFDCLYDCLLRHYDMCIAGLPQADRITELRKRLSQESGRTLHQDEGHPFHGFSD